MSSNYLWARFLLLKDLNGPLQLLDRAVLLLEQLLLRLIDLLLLQLRSNQRLIVWQSPVGLTVAVIVILEQVQVRTHRRAARLITLRFCHAGSTAT